MALGRHEEHIFFSDDNFSFFETSFLLKSVLHSTDFTTSLLLATSPPFPPERPPPPSLCPAAPFPTDPAKPVIYLIQAEGIEPIPTMQGAGRALWHEDKDSAGWGQKSKILKYNK